MDHDWMVEVGSGSGILYRGHTPETWFYFGPESHPVKTWKALEKSPCFYSTKVQSCRRRLTPTFSPIEKSLDYSPIHSLNQSTLPWCPRIPCFVANGVLENFRPLSSTTSGQRSYSSHWWQLVWVTPHPLAFFKLIPDSGNFGIRKN